MWYPFHGCSFDSFDNRDPEKAAGDDRRLDSLEAIRDLELHQQEGCFTRIKNSVRGVLFLALMASLSYVIGVSDKTEIKRAQALADLQALDPLAAQELRNSDEAMIKRATLRFNGGGGEDFVISR